MKKVNVMKWCGAVLLCCSITTVFAAAPQVSNVSVVQDAINRRVRVTYNLDMPAVVTMDIMTNDVSIGAANLWYQTGDVNRLVKTPGSKTITWHPDKAWPGNVTAPGVEVKAVVTAWSTNAPPDYMVIDLSGSRDVEYYASADALPGGVTNYLYKTSKLVMRKIPAAGVTWTMGSPTTETGRTANEEVPHSVAFTNDYYIGIYEVTLKQFCLVCGKIPWYKGTSYESYWASRTNAAESVWATYPAVYVCWNDVRNGTGWPNWEKGVINPAGADMSGFLNYAKKSNITPVTLDMPTAAEWEFACRAESGNALYATDDDTGRDLTNATTDEYLGTLAWYKSNSDDDVHPVGEKKPNVWGLYDMLGNAAEWVLDFYSNGDTYSGTFDQSGVTTEPKGPNSGTYKAIRGGNRNGTASKVRCAAASYGYAYQSGSASGFRLWAPCEAK